MTKCVDWNEIMLEPAEGISIPDRIHCTNDATQKLLDLDLCDSHYETRRAAYDANKRSNGKTTSSAPLPPIPENPEQEGPLEVGLLIHVRSSGHPERVTAAIARTVCMHLHRAFGVDSWEVRLEDGRRVVYDHLADDGEHVGHGPQVLFIESAK